MLTSDEVAAIDENSGRLTVVPVGGGAPSQLLKDAALEMVTTTYPHTTTFRVEVVDPEYLTVDVYALRDSEIFAVPKMYVGLFTIALIGFAVTFLLREVERWVIRWKPDV